jgi:predicted lipopolysaccharide heptosyltransferase III
VDGAGDAPASWSPVKILLVRLRLIGDVVFTTPLIRALRRRYPDTRLAYAVEPAAAPVLHGNPHLDELLVLPRRRGALRAWDDLAAARRLRSRRFDVVIDLHGGPRGSWLTWTTGAPMRIGYQAAGRSWMYTHTVPRTADGLSRHAVANQWDLLAPLGIELPDPARDPVEMASDPEAAARVDRILSDAGVEPGVPLVVIHVSAGNRFRRWPPESFAALIASLALRDSRRRFVLTSGPSDAGAARALVQRVSGAGTPAAGAVIDPQLEVDELRALIERAAVYIGGDSGPLHIAATTRTPVVGLFGATLPERSMPWRDPQLFAEAVDAGPLPCRPCRQRTCDPGDFRCLTRIAPERVAAAVERALGAAGQSGTAGRAGQTNDAPGGIPALRRAHA